MWAGFIFLLLGNQLVLASSTSAPSCQFDSQPRVIEENPDSANRRLLVMWNLSSVSVLESRNLPFSRDLRSYRQVVRRAIKTRPYFLLDRYADRAPDQRDLYNLRLIADGVAGEIRKINCLEALLLDFQIKRNPIMATSPTEFLAYYLEREGGLRVYLLTNDSQGVGGMNGLMREVSRDLRQGWKVIGSLHNHSFFLADLSGDKPQGVLAPSANDMRVFVGHLESLQLPKASITNGFHSVEVESRHFSLFKSAE